MSDEIADTTEVQPDAEPENASSTTVEPDVADDAELDNISTVEKLSDEDAETFPRDYVEKLRRESAAYREKAKTADELGARLHAALVAATGKLADPSDLTFNAAHLDDAHALTAAIDALTDAKPHLKARKVTGDVGMGRRGDTAEPFSLLDALKRA